jgi:hypothetical protein
MNWLLLLTTVLCFWNVWTSPTAAEEAASTRAKYQQKTTTNNSLVLQVLDGSQQHLLQLENIQGHPVVRLPPLPLGSSNSVDEFASTFGYTRVKLEQQQEQSQHDEDSTSHSSNPLKMSRDEIVNIGRKLSKQNPTYETTESSKSSSSIWSSPLMMVVFLITGSVVSGGILLAKWALDRFFKWEENEREDSLAFDIAYTTTVSEIGYGSFVSNWTGDLDKFDV